MVAVRIGLSVVLSLALVPAVGCGADEDADGQPDKLRDDIPDPPEGGVQIVTPAFSIPAGEEVFMCMRVPYVPDRDMYVQSSNIYQSNNGHHTLLFFSNNSAGVDPLPHECDGLDMTDVRIVTTGAANGTGLQMPDGVTLSVPEGAELWVQSHYINATDQERLVQDVINMELIPEAEVVEIASTFAHVDLTFSLPPQQRSTRSMECEIPREMTVPWLLPHMHEWGDHFELELTRKDEAEPFWTYEGEWFTGARNDFPIQQLDDFITLQPGDKIRTTCTWNNTEDANLLWPQEMCVTFFPFFPGDGGLLACDETGTNFVP